MTDRAAIVTGASSGIGLAIAHMLGREGYGLTVTARRPEKLDAAAAELQAAGYEVEVVAGDVGAEDVIKQVVAAHRDRYGRLDVLINNAGVGVGAPAADLSTKHIDLMLTTNLRSILLFYRESLEMLRAAGAEHRNAIVINTASFAGREGQAWLAVYGATKAAVINYTLAMNKELATEGIKSTALCPAWVDTPMTGFLEGQVAAEEMIRPEDIAIAVKMVLDVSPGCIIPEIPFVRPGDANL